MAQVIYNGTNGSNLFDASAEGVRDIAVFRALGGSDTAIGGAGADRFSSAGGADMFGGAGNDQFHIVFGPERAAASTDTIDGGTGTDGLYITISSAQLTSAFRGEMGRLDDFLQHEAGTGAHFDSSLLKLDITGVETAMV